MRVKSDHRSNFSNLSNWKGEAWKKQGFNGIRTRDLRDTGAMLYQLWAMMEYKRNVVWTTKLKDKEIRIRSILKLANKFRAFVWY